MANEPNYFGIPQLQYGQGSYTSPTGTIAPATATPTLAAPAPTALAPAQPAAQENLAATNWLGFTNADRQMGNTPLLSDEEAKPILNGLQAKNYASDIAYKENMQTMMEWQSIAGMLQTIIAVIAQWRAMDFQFKMADLQENIANHKMALEDKVADAQENIKKIELANNLEAKKIEKRAEVEIAKAEQKGKTDRAKTRGLREQFFGRQEPYYGTPLYS